MIFARRIRNCLNFVEFIKHNYEKKWVRQLKLDNDELLLDETKISECVTDYYQTLYNSNDTCGNYDLFNLQAKELDGNVKNRDIEANLR